MRREGFWLPELTKYPQLQGLGWFPPPPSTAEFLKLEFQGRSSPIAPQNTTPSRTRPIFSAREAKESWKRLASSDLFYFIFFRKRGSCTEMPPKSPNGEGWSWKY